MNSLLRDLRRKTGFKIIQVAKATGLSKGFLSHLETGKIKYPSAQTMYCLAKFYSVSVDYIVENSVMLDDIPPVEPAQIKETLEDRINRLEKQVDELRARHIVFGNLNPSLAVPLR